MKHDTPGRRWTRIFRPDARAEVEEELAFHLEQRVRDNIARGMDPEAARTAAQQRFGDLKSVRTECTALLEGERRAERRSYFMKMSWLDVKLGLRMLIKYPGLTIVGGLAIALAIAVGTFAFEIGGKVIRPTVPLPDGDRIVALRLWHLPSSSEEGQSLYDFLIWRDQLESVEELGAYRDVNRNLVTRDGQSAAIRVAEITASAFRVARVQPLLGRPLVDGDEQPAAQPVMVIGERVWKQHFHGDPAVVGQTVRLGRLQSTVVGVMPESFAFPVSHGAWAPLRTYALDAGPREGSPIRVFGRLRAGKTIDEAQAELSVLGARASAENPTTHEHIRPEIMPYPRSFFNASWSMVTAAAFSGQLGVLVFLVLVCANVATLVFARTATRESEIVVRNALGASRGRIVTQLLVETLVLGGFAALIGLSVAAYGIRVALSLVDTQTRLPFWVNDGLSALTMFYAVLLTILAAVISGVVPALKVTRGLGQRLRQAAVGGANLQFGRIWTGLIVTQVALTVVFMAIAFDTQRDTARARALKFGFRANEYLSVRLEMDREAAATEAAEVPYAKEEFERFRTSFGELERRLVAEPAVAGVTYAQSFPGTYHDRGRIEVEGSAAPPKSGSGHQTLIGFVGVNYFDALEVPIVAGRGFQSGDLEIGDPVGRPTGSSLPRSRVVVVNQTFVQQVFGGGNAVGRRVRHVFCRGEKCNGDPRLRPNEAGKIEEWYEIIGVVKDIAMTGDPDRLGSGLGGLYHPWAPGDSYWAGLALHVRGDPDEFAPRLRAIAATVDPSLRLHEVRSLDDLYNESLKPYDVAYRGTLLASAIVLLLSVAGIYSITAFTVARRTREIGIRVALGGNPRRILWSVFSRAILQVTIGVVAGGTLMVALMRGIKTADEALILLVPIGIMLGVCALACIVPTRRALRIQPVDALKAEA